MRPCNPSVTISYGIPENEAGGKAAQIILEELKLEYTRGIAPSKAVALRMSSHGAQLPLKYDPQNPPDPIEFHFRGGR
jgi:hypothetical protein